MAASVLFSKIGIDNLELDSLVFHSVVIGASALHFVQLVDWNFEGDIVQEGGRRGLCWVEVVVLVSHVFKETL